MAANNNTSQDEQNDASESNDPAAEFYCVDPNYRPVSAKRTGSQRTDGQGAYDVRAIAPIFAIADDRSALTAKRALDPDDPTPEAFVNLPDNDEAVASRREGAIERIRNLAREVEGRLGFEDKLASAAVRTPEVVADAAGNDENAPASARDAAGANGAGEPAPAAPAASAPGAPVSALKADEPAKDAPKADEGSPAPAA